MRKPFARQQRLDCPSIGEVELNLECRHELIPILRTLRHIYSRPEVRDRILDLIGQDVNKDSRIDCGREGFGDWQVLVLAAVRLGCNLDYDQLQDLAEEHRKLRQIMGIGEWDDKTSFDWQRIRDNVGLLRPSTIDAISQAIVAEGHRLEPDAAKKVRGDSFVVETNIHWPSESSLIRDGVRKMITICLALCAELDLRGWRQHSHLLAKVNRLACEIDRIAAKKGANYQERLGGQIEGASFDRGFHSPENQVELAKIIAHPCLPKPGAKQAAAQAASATVQFRAARQRHPGMESALGALQSGNGLQRCRDHTEIGFERYVSLGILGRNLQVLGKLLIAREDADCQAACSQRLPPAA